MTWDSKFFFVAKTIGALYAALLCLAFNDVSAQVVRIAPHADENYVRLAFDWPEITAYRINLGDDVRSISMSFGQDITSNLPALNSDVRSYITRIEKQSSNQVLLVLAENMTFRPFRFNNSIVIDILPGNFSATIEKFIAPPIAARQDDDTQSPSDDAARITIPTESDILEENLTVRFDSRSGARRKLEVVEINTYSLQGGGRIEFVWAPPAPNYRASLQKNRLVVSFSRPFTSDDLVAVEPSLPFSIGPANIINDSRSFVMPTTGNIAISHRRFQNKIVIDVLPDDDINAGNLPPEAVISGDSSQGANIIAGYQQLPDAALDRDVAQPRQGISSNNVFASEAVDVEGLTTRTDDLGTQINSVRVGRTSEYTRLIFDFTTNVQYLIEHRNQEMQITFGQNASIDTSNLIIAQDEPFLNPRIRQLDNTTLFLMGVPDNYNIRHFRSGAKIIIDLLAQQENIEQADNLPDTLVQGDTQSFDTLPFTFPKTALNRRVGSDIGILPPAEHSISIPLTENIGIAFFEHGGYYWFVADRRLPLPLTQIAEDATPLFLEVIRIKHPEATILRFTPTRSINASIAQKGFNYILRFHETPYQSPYSLSAHIQRDGKNHKFLLISSREVGKTIIFDDPSYQNKIFVGTFRNLGLSNAQRRDFIEFSLLATQQGIAVTPYADDISMIETETGYIINKSSGLNVIQQKLEDEITQQKDPSTLAILNFPPLSYSNLPFLETRQQLNSSLDFSSDATTHNDFYLSAATFYLSQRLPHEALGYIGLYENNSQSNTDLLLFRLLKASILLLLERTDPAITILSDPVFSSFEESVLWQGVAAAQKKQWEAAKLRFDRSSDFIRRYPVYLRNWITALQIETAFQVNDLVAAQSWMDVLRPFVPRMNVYQRQRFTYYEGLFSLRKDNIETAYETWDRMRIEKPNSRWVVLADLNQLTTEVESGRLSLESTIASLEHLRYLWRGDDLELQILSRLGQLYLDTGDVRKGLTILRNAAAFFPDNPAALLLTQEMLAVFRSVFLEEDDTHPIDAQTSLEMLQDFRELLPLGPERVEIISSIANNLIEEQFYNNAVDLLQPLVNERLLTSGQKRNLIVKIGLLHIIAENPEEAINVFETYRSDLGIESSDESIDARRLYAKALIDLQQTESALDLIAGDLSPSADLLRRDIFWDTQDWHRASLAMQRLTGDTPGEDLFLNDIQASSLIGWLLSLQLSEQDDTLERVAKRYEKSMQQSPLLSVFDYIRNIQLSDFTSDGINALLKTFSQQSSIRTFLSEYRDRYFNEAKS